MANFSSFPADILFCIAEHISSKYTLAQCSLVCRVLGDIASKVLYYDVVYEPPQSRVLVVLDRGDIPSKSQLASASLPKYATFVQSLTVAGHICAKPPPMNVFPNALLKIITTFVNLRSVAFVPTTYHVDIFTNILPLFKPDGKFLLTSLTVNVSCLDEPRAEMLAMITGLERLTMLSPTRASLMLLPDWLSKLSGTLSELHLKGNCGSITPGVLKSLLPPIFERLHKLSLGLSYSLTDEHVFSFMGSIPHLEAVALQYYMQLNQPEQIPSFPSLRSFHVSYTTPEGRDAVHRLCEWVQRSISASPVELITLSPVDVANSSWPIEAVCYDNLFQHLDIKLAKTLREANMAFCLFTTPMLLEIIQQYRALEVLVFTGMEDVLDALIDSPCFKTMPRLNKLHILSPLMYTPTQEEVEQFFQSSPASLRHFCVNECSWESYYAVSTTGEIRLVVVQIL